MSTATKTVKTAKQQDGAVGVTLLTKARAATEEARKLFGEYTAWVAEYDISVEMVTTQWMYVFSCSYATAEKRARQIKRLGQPEHQVDLDALCKGELDFFLACARAT